MADTSWEHAADARAALTAIVTDPEHGVSALSSPRTMSNLLKDLLPDAPREKNLLVAAAEAGLANTLREHVDQGMDSGTAIRLTASSFSERSPLSPDACTWVTSEIAKAMGMSEGAAPGVAPWGDQAGWGADARSGSQDSFSPRSQNSPPADPGPAAGVGQGGWDARPGSAPGVGGGGAGAGGSAAGAGGWGAGSPGSAPGSGGWGVPNAGASPGNGSSGNSSPGNSNPSSNSGGTSNLGGIGYAPAPATGYPGQPGYAPGPSGPPFGPLAGQAYPPAPVPGYQPVPGPSRSSNTMAVVAFVLGLVQFIGWIIFLLPGLIAAILAIVLGFVSLKQIRRTGEGGRGLAITGVILGFAGIVIVAILVAIGVAAVNKNS
ncbi:MAG: DUF4190 domain-containing protein [Streptosporangiaceae bacterium]